VPHGMKEKLAVVGRGTAAMQIGTWGPGGASLFRGGNHPIYINMKTLDLPMSP